MFIMGLIIRRIHLIMSIVKVYYEIYLLRVLIVMCFKIL